MELKCLFPYIVAVQRQKSIFSELSGIVFTLLTEKKKILLPKCACASHITCGRSQGNSYPWSFAGLKTSPASWKPFQEVFSVLLVTCGHEKLQGMDFCGDRQNTAYCCTEAHRNSAKRSALGSVHRKSPKEDKVWTYANEKLQPPFRCWRCVVRGQAN